MKTILLIGAGAAHRQVARLFAQRWRGYAKDCRVVWIAGQARYCEPSLVPAWLADQVKRDDIFLDLKTLAERAGFELVADTVNVIDPKRRHVRTRGGKTFTGDLISLNTGSGEALASDEALPLQPVQPLVEQILRLRADWFPGRALKFVQFGATAYAIEHTLHLAIYLRKRQIPFEIQIFERERMPLSLNEMNLQRLTQFLQEHGIALRTGLAAKPLSRREYQMGSQTFSCDLVTHSLPHPLPSWLHVLKATGDRLPVDETLQVLGAPGIFAAGDLALTGQNLPRTGAISHFQGYILAANLSASCRQKKLRLFRGPRWTFDWISTGEQSAFLRFQKHFWGPHKWLWQIRQWWQQSWLR